jgi:hypothetical protein
MVIRSAEAGRSGKVAAKKCVRALTWRKREEVTAQAEKESKVTAAKEEQNVGTEVD